MPHWHLRNAAFLRLSNPITEICFHYTSLGVYSKRNNGNLLPLSRFDALWAITIGWLSRIGYFSILPIRAANSMSTGACSRIFSAVRRFAGPETANAAASFCERL